MKYEFEVLRLPYGYSDLEPFIDTRTMHFHFDKHFQTYINNLNNLLKDLPNFHDYTLEEIIYNIEKFPKDLQEDILFNAGGVFNHLFYFNGLEKYNEVDEKMELFQAMKRDFGSFENFKEKFINEAASVKGSGWTWLVLDQDGKLKIVSTKNHNVVIKDNMYPIIVTDVWEHAYYLKHQDRRKTYLEYWFKVVDFERANEYYKKAASKI